MDLWTDLRGFRHLSDAEFADGGFLLRSYSPLRILLLLLSFGLGGQCGRPAVDVPERPSQKVAEQVAAAVVHDYARAENLQPGLFSPAIVAQGCKCIDVQCSRETECVTEISPRFLDNVNAWQFEFKYDGRPRHQIGFLIGSQGISSFNSDRAPSHFGRAGHRIDYAKYRRLLKPE